VFKVDSIVNKNVELDSEEMDKLTRQLAEFLDTSLKLPKNTYTIFKNFIDILETPIAEMKILCRRKGVGIFQNGETNDQKRIQVELKNISTDLLHDLRLDQITTKLENFFKHDLFSNEKFSLFGSLLYSKVGCSAQHIHTDYPCEENHKETTNKSFIVILALCDSTVLHVIDRYKVNQEIKFNAGDLLLARGGLYHGGAAYEKTNVRIHYYVDCENCIRNKDETCLITDDFQKMRFEFYYNEVTHRFNNLVEKTNEINTTQNQYKSILSNRLMNTNTQKNKTKKFWRKTPQNQFKTSLPRNQLIKLKERIQQKIFN
jgi:hypothetical protein